MITIQVLGLDQFVVGRYSRENSGNVAQILECDEADISFYAPNSMMFHNGVEQTSWNTLVVVLAPKKYQAVESAAADFLMKSLSFFSINVEVVFQYFEESSHYSFVNKEYPRFITTDEIRDDSASMEFGDVPEFMEGEEDLAEQQEEEENCDCGHHHHIHEEEADIYLGDAFEGFEERYEESRKKKN